MTEVKFCKDCKFFIPDYIDWGRYPKCEKKVPDFINGGKSINTHYNFSCVDMRGSFCGKEAKYFEPKEISNEN